MEVYSTPVWYYGSNCKLTTCTDRIDRQGVAGYIYTYNPSGVYCSSYDKTARYLLIQNGGWIQAGWGKGYSPAGCLTEPTFYAEHKRGTTYGYYVLGTASSGYHHIRIWFDPTLNKWRIIIDGVTKLRLPAGSGPSYEKGFVRAVSEISCDSNCGCRINAFGHFKLLHYFSTSSCGGWCLWDALLEHEGGTCYYIQKITHYEFYVKRS